MAITFTNQGASAAPDLNDNSDATSYVTGSWTPPSSGLIVVDVITFQASGFPSAPAVTGNSLTWTQIATVTFASVRRLTRYGANASGSTTGTTTFDTFGGSTQLGIRASFYSVAGSDVDNGVVQTFVQSPTSTGTVSPGSITLSAVSDANNRPIAAFANDTSNIDQTPRASWTELDDLHNFGSLCLSTQYRSDAFETTASATWTTGSLWLGIASEIKVASAGGGGVVLDPMGMTGFFGG